MRIGCTPAAYIRLQNVDRQSYRRRFGTLASFSARAHVLGTCSRCLEGFLVRCSPKFGPLNKV